jgi:hypothetical protein
MDLPRFIIVTLGGDDVDIYPKHIAETPTQLRVTIPICHIRCHYHTCTSLYRPSLGFTAQPCTYSSGQLVRWALHLPSNHTPQLRKRGAHTHLNQTLTGGPEEHREVSPLDDRPPAKSLLDYGIIGTGLVSDNFCRLRS